MTLPIDFCIKSYKQNNKDLQHLDNQEIVLHYLLEGRKEKRKYKKQEKKKVLYFSPQWPSYNRSSGGKRTLEILKTLKDECDVYYFINEGPNEEYEKVLKEMGKVYFHRENNLYESIKELKRNKLNFEVVFFSWWESAKYFSEAVKLEFPKIKTVADSVDVHWLREERGKISTEEKKEAEKLVYKSCDVVLAVTHEDAAEIEKECGIKNVKVLSNIHEEKNKTHLQGNDVLFVGGFNHPPNISAAIRTYDLYRKFRNESGIECSLYIVGDNPPESIKSLHNGKNVIVTGFVEDIKPYFNMAKVLLAPLTWGAGIKGKICEAVMHKVPVLTSKVGAEGFNFNNFEECFIAEKDREFVGCLKHIYNLKNDAIVEITNKAFKKVENKVSVESARSVIKSIVHPEPHVVVSIVTYKNKELVEECLKSIEDNTEYSNFKIIVTDNGNEKEVENIVQKFCKKGLDIEYVKNKENEYFSIPNNRIIKRFKDSDIILLNDDTIIKTKCWIKEIQNSAYASGDIACCGGKALMTDGKIEEAGSMIMNNGYGFNLGRGANANEPKYNVKKFVGYCSGSLLYMRRDAIEKIGLLDENFKPLYYEDTDWQYRAHLAGLEVLYNPFCVYVHKGRSTTRNNLNEYIELSRKTFVEKYRGKDLEAYASETKWSL